EATSELPTMFRYRNLPIRSPVSSSLWRLPLQPSTDAVPADSRYSTSWSGTVTSSATPSYMQWQMPGAAALLADLTTFDDAAIVERCQFLFAHMMNDDLAAWEALGDEYHARLAKNYVT
ncbi:MAG: hypothetical protein QOF88_6919, partial [Mycobacterium sp.]|nr:hypothetical protein [Mycobacterium sp.]